MGKLNDEILISIDTIVTQRLKEKSPINFCEGIIKQVNINNTYDVMINDEIQTVHRINNDTYNVGSVVKILILKNDYYILTIKDSIII